MKKIMVLALVMGIAGCSSMVTNERRQFVDSTTHSDAAPDWVKTTKVAWEQNGKMLLRSSYTVNGTDRLNGCFDLARMDSKEALLSEIANDVKGSLDNAQQSISENAELVLGKVRSGEFSGRITGLRFTEQYFERYRIGEVERVDCHVLGEIKDSDYNQIKRSVVQGIAAVDPRLKEAISRKQIEFFGHNEVTRDAAAQKEVAKEAVSNSDKE
jgi:hypothetical protein